MKHLKTFENYLPNDDALDLFNDTNNFKELVIEYWKSSPTGGGSIEFCDWLINKGYNVYNGDTNLTPDNDWYDILREFDDYYEGSTEYTDFLRWLELKRYSLK
jgi:hypothetical protein